MHVAPAPTASDDRPAGDRALPKIAAAPIRQDVPTRPAWARRMDRAVLRISGIVRRVLPRPRDGALERLARAHRGPRPDLPTLDVPAIDTARKAQAEGRYGEALHLFGELLAADADSAWAWHGRGDCLQLLGRPDDALDAYARAAGLAPREGLHHAGQANALSALGRDDDAAAAWARALQLDPSLTWMKEGRPPPG